jgi:hypothetical protein
MRGGMRVRSGVGASGSGMWGRDVHNAVSVTRQISTRETKGVPFQEAARIRKKRWELKTWEEPADKAYGKNAAEVCTGQPLPIATRQGVPSCALWRVPGTNHPASFVPAASVRAGDDAAVARGVR